MIWKKIKLYIRKYWRILVVFLSFVAGVIVSSKLRGGNGDRPSFDAVRKAKHDMDVQVEKAVNRIKVSENDQKDARERQADRDERASKYFTGLDK